jgi:hypothetical protein
MFDKISETAEKLATNVSRRAFLGRLGQGALVTAGVLAGMFAFSGKAWAFSGGGMCCLCSSTCYSLGPNNLCLSPCRRVTCSQYRKVCPQT